MPARQTPRYVALAVAAEYLGDVDVKTIRRMISRGHIAGFRLPGSRLLRVDLNELDAALRPVPTAGDAA